MGHGLEGAFAGGLEAYFPASQAGPVTLEQLAALYDWHGRHHVAQVRTLRDRNGW